MDEDFLLDLENSTSYFEEFTESVLGKELLIIAIEISDNSTANIVVRENDDPQKLAVDFCIKNKLDPALARFIAAQIIENLNEENRKKEHIDEEARMLTPQLEPSHARHKDYFELASQYSDQLESPQTKLRNYFESAQSSEAPRTYASRVQTASPKRRQVRSPKKENVQSPGKPQSLYDRGVAQARRAELSRQKARQQQEEAEKQQSTFQPRINKTSSLVRAEPKRKPLYERAKALHTKMENKWKASPPVSSREQVNVTDTYSAKRRSPQIFKSLYDDSTRRRLQKPPTFSSKQPSHLNSSCDNAALRQYLNQETRKQTPTRKPSPPSLFVSSKYRGNESNPDTKSIPKARNIDVQRSRDGISKLRKRQSQNPPLAKSDSDSRFSRNSPKTALSTQFSYASKLTPRSKLIK